MHIDALLSDFATVREGLLHMLGGGVNRLWRDKYPASMGLSLGLCIEVHRTEARQPHNLVVIVQDEDGQRLSEVSAQFEVNREFDTSRPGECTLMPLVLSLQTIALPRPGSYSVEILVDGQHKRSLVFLAELLAPSDRRTGDRSSRQN
jgi:hypothetical protein